MLKPLLLAAALAGTWSGTCVAHAHLQSSTPASNARLSQAPSTLTLNFSEEAELAVLKLSTAGNTIAVALDRTMKPSASITVALPALPAGKYDVQWTAIAHDDGHVTRGSFSFTVLGS
jgi:copper resistance protein C